MQHLIIIIMAVVYLLASVRYYPGNLGKTAFETTLHIVSAAPFSIGCTLLFAVFFQKLAKTALPVDRIIRIFLALAILLELILGIQNYIGTGTTS